MEMERIEQKHGEIRKLTVMMAGVLIAAFLAGAAASLRRMVPSASETPFRDHDPRLQLKRRGQFKNTGTTTWTDAANYHLGAVGDSTPSPGQDGACGQRLHSARPAKDIQLHDGLPHLPGSIQPTGGWCRTASSGLAIR